MIKDLLVAISLGAVLGFGVTGGFFILNKSNQNKIDSSSTPIVSVIPDQPTPIPTSSPVINENLNIDLPLDESVLSTPKTTLKGTSKPDSFIIIKTPIKTYTLTASKSGAFSSEIDLETGINLIKISAIDADDNQYDTQLFVTYSTSKF